MSNRGEFRSIRKVLLDGPNFQELSAGARWTFVVVKMTLGFAGIGVIPAAAAVIAEKSGLSISETEAAFDELKTNGWLDWQKNIFYVIGGLKHEPGVSPENAKHRVSLQNQIEALPHVEIVEKFQKDNAIWFDKKAENEPEKAPESEGHAEATDSLSNGYGEGSDVRRTDDVRRKTGDDDVNARGAPPPDFKPSNNSSSEKSYAVPDLNDPLTCAVLEATGKLAAFRRGARSPNDVSALAKVRVLLDVGNRTEDDVGAVAKLWEDLGKTPMNLNQFLEKFDSLLARSRQQQLKPREPTLDELSATAKKYQKPKPKEIHAG